MQLKKTIPSHLKGGSVFKLDGLLRKKSLSSSSSSSDILKDRNKKSMNTDCTKKRGNGFLSSENVNFFWILEVEHCCLFVEFVGVGSIFKTHYHIGYIIELNLAYDAHSGAHPK